MSNITLLGLGAMGTALADAFLTRGHRVTLWNRSPGRAAPLVARGAVHAASVSEAIEASTLVVICVLDYPAVRDILETAAGRLAGRTVVNLTNGTPAQARAMAGWVSGHGADYIDGAIMVTPELISGPDAFILYSGAGAAYSSHEKTLAVLGSSVHVGDDAALAPLYDLALLSAMFGLFGGYLHAAALLRSEQIPVTEVTPMITALLAAMTGLLPEIAGEIDGGSSTEPTSNNRMMAAALGNIVDGSTGQRIRTDLMTPIRALFDHGVARGAGDLDIAALVPLLAASAAPADAA